jgi:hypothetical protein
VLWCSIKKKASRTLGMKIELLAAIKAVSSQLSVGLQESVRPGRW